MKNALSFCLGVMLAASAHAQLPQAHSGDGEHGRDRVLDSRSHGAEARHSRRWSGHAGFSVGHSRHGWGRAQAWDSYPHHQAWHSWSSHPRLHDPFYSRDPFCDEYPFYGAYPVASHYPSYGYYRGYDTVYPYSDGYAYNRASRASSSTSGLLLGALAGGIIGHNSGTLANSAWRGAAWGAGLGWVLGAVADANRRVAAPADAPVVQTSTPVVTPSTAQPAPQAAATRQISARGTTPMSAANALFGRN